MEITQQQLNYILAKMFDMVGAKYSEEFVKESDWFIKYTWTESQQNNFLVWLTDFLLRQNIFSSRDLAEKTAEIFILNFGWKCDCIDK